MNIRDIIDRVGYFRNRANLSARALSLEIDKNPAYITKLESGEYEPSMSVILYIISACNTTPEEFFYSDIACYSTDKELLKIVADLSIEKKKALRDLLK